ncbi:MAG TPA: hypothetical protein VFI03_07805 [Solirubrobacterales bacterium]|nr:hypothetical protein [Solirubrobacterales bacterium]
MIWRILLTVLFAGALATTFALENFNPEMSGYPLLVVWLVGWGVGFLVGRWWAVLAVVGALVGRVIGWDPGESDGNPALWWPYVVMTIIFFGTPLLVGWVASGARDSIVSRRSD